MGILQSFWALLHYTHQWPWLSSLHCPCATWKWVLFFCIPPRVTYDTSQIPLIFHLFFCWDTDFPIFLSQVTGFWASPSLKSLQRNTLSQRQDGHTFFSFCLQPLLVAFYCGLWSKCLHWMWRFTWKVSICSFSLLKIYFSPMKCHLRSLLLLSWVFCVGEISLWGYNAPSFSSEMWKNLCVHSAQLSHCPLHWWSKDRRKPDMRSFFMFIFT